MTRYKLGPIFTPPVVSKAEGPLGTLAQGVNSGGTVWAGGSYDPDTHILYVYSRTSIGSLSLLPSDGKRSDMNYIQGNALSGVRAGGGSGSAAGADAAPPPAAEPEGNPPLTIQGLPLARPPWGRITAIDMNKGEMVWQIAHGETPDVVRNHPALKGVTIPRTGRPGIIGTLVTKTLVIAGEAGFFTTPSGQRGAMLRAYNKASGQEVGAVYMPAPQTGSPMTYMLNGKQYIVVAISGGNYSGEYVAFKLPS